MNRKSHVLNNRPYFTLCVFLRISRTAKGRVLSDVHVRVRYMLSPVRLSSVCNARAPQSAGWNFRQCFYAIWYIGYPLTSTENFMEIVRGELLRRGIWRQVHSASKNFPPLTCYNLDIHGSITIIFGKHVTEEAGNHSVLYFPTSPN